MTISFTRAELTALTMLVESASRRTDDAQVQSIHRKLQRITPPPTVEELQRQVDAIRQANAMILERAQRAM